MLDPDSSIELPSTRRGKARHLDVKSPTSYQKSSISLTKEPSSSDEEAPTSSIELPSTRLFCAKLAGTRPIWVPVIWRYTNTLHLKMPFLSSRCLAVKKAVSECKATPALCAGVRVELFEGLLGQVVQPCHALCPSTFAAVAAHAMLA